MHVQRPDRLRGRRSSSGDILRDHDWDDFHDHDVSVPGMQLDMCVVFVRFSEGAVLRLTRNPLKSASKSVKSDRGASEFGHHHHHRHQ